MGNPKAVLMTLNEFEIWYRMRFWRTSSAYYVLAMIISDLIGAMLSFGAGFFVVNMYNMGAINFRSFVTYWPYLPVFVIVFQMFSLYPGIALAPAEELKHFTIGSAIAFGGIIFSRFIEDAEFDAISVAFIISFFFATFVFLACRSVMRALLSVTNLGGIPAVIYGSGPLMKTLIDKLQKYKTLGYIPVVILSEYAEFDEYKGVPVIRDISLGPLLVKKFNLKMAILGISELEEKKLFDLLVHSVSAFRYYIMIPSFVNITNIWMSIRDFNGILGFAGMNRLNLRWNRAYKRALDLLIVMCGGIVVLPFLLLTGLLIKVSSKGPVL
jgi:FlaA1/EpsC-like NDP-sugar epimerase